MTVYGPVGLILHSEKGKSSLVRIQKQLGDERVSVSNYGQLFGALLTQNVEQKQAAGMKEVADTQRLKNLIMEAGCLPPSHRLSGRHIQKGKDIMPVNQAPHVPSSLRKEAFDQWWRAAGEKKPTSPHFL
ncbi:hypothetical protein AOLI_G00177220 [Acnodon oligacanthus]